MSENPIYWYWASHHDNDETRAAGARKYAARFGVTAPEPIVISATILGVVLGYSLPESYQSEVVTDAPSPSSPVNSFPAQLNLLEV